MARRKTLRRGAGRVHRPRVEGLESRQLLAVSLLHHPLPSSAENPTSIVRGPDNNMYFTVPAVVANGVLSRPAAIGVINPSTKAIAEFPAPNPTSSLGPIISGPNGGLWFADNNNITHTAAIGVFNPANHAVGETTITNFPGISISGLAAGPDNNLYFTDAGNNAVGRFNPVTGAVVEFPLPNKMSTSPSLLVADGGGNLWFATSTLSPTTTPSAINEFNTTTHAITSFPLPTGFGVTADTLGPDGNIYLSEAVAFAGGTGQGASAVNLLGSINPTTGAMKTFGQINAGGITTGPDGNIWFVSGEVVLATGVTTTFPIPGVLPASSTLQIATGPDGHLYFTETGAIGELIPVPPSQSVLVGAVTLDPLGRIESGNPIAGQVVFVDLKGDGNLDPGDPSAVTDATGIYQIPGLPAGTYIVRLFASPGNTITSPQGGAQLVTVVAFQNTIAAPFAILPTSILLPVTFSTTPFGTNNPDVQTAEVKGLYQSILNRAPSAAELSAVVAVVKNGTPLSTIATTLLGSNEYVANYIKTDYVIYLGVNPSAADVNAWVQIVQAQKLTSTQVASLFLNTPEFSALHPDNASFIQALYFDVFGRQAFSSEVSAWTSVLASGTTRAQAINSVLNSPAAAQRAVDGLYSVFLGHPPDTAEPFWVAAVLTGTPLTRVVATFASGPDFVNRALATVG